MKKIIIFIIVFLYFINPIYADENREHEYTAWSNNKTNYPYEKQILMYGYKYPVSWSEWSVIKELQPFARTTNIPYETNIPDDKRHWYSKGVQQLYSWPEYGEFPEAKTLLSWLIDIDACDNRNYDIEHYYEPKMELVCTLDTGANVVVDRTPGRGGSEENMSINMYGNGEYKCKKVTLNMVAPLPTDGNYSSINVIGTVRSYVSFRTPVFSRVVLWSNEGIGWRETGPYQNYDRNGDGYYDDPIYPVTTYYYKHPKYYYIDYFPIDNEINKDEYNNFFNAVYPSRHPKTGEINRNSITCLISNSESNLSKDSDGCPILKEDEFIRSPYIKGYGIFGFYDNSEYRGNNINKIKGIPQGDMILYPKIIRLKPRIDVEQRYIYEDDTIDTIKELAKSEDEIDGDISDKVIINNITYDDSGENVNYPSYFDPTISDTIHVTYEVSNNDNVKAEKTIKLYILKEGKFVDLQINDRYISRDYLYTLDNNSVWKSDTYMNSLNNAFNWLERK